MISVPVGAPSSEDDVAPRFAGQPGSMLCRKVGGSPAARRHAASGGPRGRALASTVAGANCQATTGRGAIAISTGWKSVETAAGGCRTKAGPATQKTQWASTACPSGAPGWSGKASWRHSSKPAQPAAPTASAPTASAVSRAPAMANARPCKNRAQTRRHTVSRRHHCHPCAFRCIAIPELTKTIGAVSADAIKFHAQPLIWNTTVARRAHRSREWRPPASPTTATIGILHATATWFHSRPWPNSCAASSERRPQSAGAAWRKPWVVGLRCLQELSSGISGIETSLDAAPRITA